MNAKTPLCEALAQALRGEPKALEARLVHNVEQQGPRGVLYGRDDVLQALARLHPERVVPRMTLAGAVWPGAQGEAALYDLKVAGRDVGFAVLAEMVEGRGARLFWLSNALPLPHTSDPPPRPAPPVPGDPRLGWAQGFQPPPEATENAAADMLIDTLSRLFARRHLDALKDLNASEPTRLEGRARWCAQHLSDPVFLPLHMLADAERIAVHWRLAGRVARPDRSMQRVVIEAFTFAEVKSGSVGTTHTLVDTAALNTQLMSVS